MQTEALSAEIVFLSGGDLRRYWCAKIPSLYPL